MLIKICGITSPETAVDCFAAGADMVGLVYFPPSPRHIGVPAIEKILDAVEPYRQSGRKTVLVTVDSLPEKLDSRIDYIQNFGKVELDVPCQKIRVVKSRDVFGQLLTGDPVSGRASVRADSGLYALEMSQGILPGGNGAAWDWHEARPFCSRFPTLLAGGITPDNVTEAAEQAQPFGIDASSGVESAPGVKDFGKIQRMIERLLKCR
jgi:phosphoribosylanthranilate isomerase